MCAGVSVCMCACIQVHMCVRACVCVCLYVCVCSMYVLLLINIGLFSGLEIDGIASSNANHFRGNCESLWQSDSPNFLGYTANHFGRLRITFQMDSSKDFFFYPHPFFRQILYIGCKNANKLRIMIRNCKSLSQSVLQLRRLKNGESLFVS